MGRDQRDQGPARAPTAESSPWVVGLGSALAAAAQTQAQQGAAGSRPSDAQVLEQILELSPAGILLLDGGGDIVSANRKALEILGFEKERVGAAPPEPFRAGESPLREAARSGWPLRCHLHAFVRPDGSQAVISIDASPLNDHYVAVFEDVTTRTDSEHAVRASERRYRDLFERMIDGFALHEILLDADGRPADYRFLDVNPAFERMTGLRKEAVIGRTVLEVLPDTERSWIDIYGEVALTGDSVRFENFSGALGRYFDVVAFSPARGRFATVFIETTDRVVAEKRLRESEERLRAVVDHMPVMLHAFDEAGRVVFWNRESERVSGLAAGEVAADRFLLEALYPLSSSRERLLGRGEAAEEGLGRDVLLRRPDGEERLVAWTDLSGQAPIPGWHRWGIGLDLTDHRHLEEQFRHAQKMEAVGRLAGGVAHDFNNLLTAILGYCDLLELKMESDHPRLREIREIQTIAARSGLLTQQLLAFSRRQALDPRVLDLGEVLKDLEGMLGRLLGEDVDLRLRLAEEPALVRIDPGQLQQIVVNLAVNARDAMPEGGRLVLESGVHEAAEGPRVVLSVSDTGVGMEAEVATRIFEPFFTTKEAGRGTGLGLSTVHGIVHQSGGTISVESTPGGGSTFRVTLPRVGADDRAEGRPPEAPCPSAGQETILVVEDSEGVRELIRELLEARGFCVLDAGTAEEALELTEEHRGPLHLLLADLVLPGMNGLALGERLVGLRPGLRVLYMSGYAEGSLAARGAMDPTLPFLQKPFRANALVEAVRTALDA